MMLKMISLDGPMFHGLGVCDSLEEVEKKLAILAAIWKPFEIA